MFTLMDWVALAAIVGVGVFALMFVSGGLAALMGKRKARNVAAKGK